MRVRVFSPCISIIILSAVLNACGGSGSPNGGPASTTFSEIQNFSVLSVNAVEVVLKWDAAQGEEPEGYKLMRGEQDFPASCLDGIEIPLSSDKSATIKGLTEQTDYFFRLCIITITDSGVSFSKGSILKVTTLPRLQFDSNPVFVNIENASNFALRGQCSGIGRQVEVKIGSRSVTTECSINGLWDATFDMSSASDGVVTAHLSYASQALSESKEILVDRTSPTTSIISGPRSFDCGYRSGCDGHQFLEVMVRCEPGAHFSGSASFINPVTRADIGTHMTERNSCDDGGYAILKFMTNSALYCSYSGFCGLADGSFWQGSTVTIIQWDKHGNPGMLLLNLGTGITSVDGSSALHSYTILPH